MLIDGSRLVQIKIGEGDVDDAVRLSKIHPLDGRTLGDRAYAQISELLIAGILAPGDKLSLRATADLLGVSMMPVREAVTRMVADRALEVAPNRAIRVPVMSAVQFRDLTNVRIMVEGHAASEAARLASPEDLARVARAELAFRNQRSLAKPDLGLAVKLNQAFHFALYKAAHSAVLLDIIRGAVAQGRAGDQSRSARQPRTVCDDASRAVPC